MAVTVNEVREAFQLLYCNILDRKFRKTLDLHHWSEKEMLPLVRTFLLGWFGRCVPEVTVRLPSAPSGYGRIDFLLGDVAVEFAVRRPLDHKGPLSSKVNTTEMIKLMMYEGKGLLVLFDFSANPFEAEDIERFREYPSLGKGNHRRSPFNVAYFYIDKRFKGGGQYQCISKNIRVTRRT